MKDRFPIANKVFPLIEHFVSSYENRLFFLIKTKHFFTNCKGSENQLTIK